MKKTFFYALAAIAALTTGCSKDAGIDGSGAVGGGKYTLPAVSATLDGSGVETKTGLGTNQVVNWSAKDRIAIINTKNDRIYQYELVSGQGTSVGKFEPVNTVAAYDDINDLKAVYPAVAAEVDGGTISFTINSDWSEEHRTKYNITSWTKDTPYAFTHNDIKVSYNTLEVPSNDQTPVNFKFRQLGTWCAFTFDFTGTAYTREAMESMEITTVGGSKKISGKASVNLADPAAPSLGEGTETAVSWTFNSPASLSAPVGRSLMLFPGVDGDQLKITVKTALHTFTFYATPTQALSAGTVLRFPIEVGKNFSENTTLADFTYTVEDATGIVPFIYYGKSNCLLLASGKTSGSLDITPYAANTYYEQTGTKATNAPAATKASIIWRETSLTMSDPTVSGNTLNISGVSGSGNALVGIYDASDNLLWSYHVWCPDSDVDMTEKTYSVTKSGSYQVMPLALGATQIASAGNINGAGLWYQWGRKDPLGRPSAWNTSGTVAVDVFGSSPLTASTTYFTATGDGAANMQKLNDLLDDPTKYNEATDGPSDRFMIEWAIKNPTKFIYVKNNTYNNNWCGKINDDLWGNATGYNFPRASQLTKSVFDPCPEGYRVAPKDLWLNFSTTKENTNTSTDPSKETFNANNVDDFPTEYGYNFYYSGNRTDGGETDFYPASGYRNRTSGALSSVGTSGFAWSSSPYASGNVNAGHLYFHASYVCPLDNNNRANGFPVRCVRE